MVNLINADIFIPAILEGASMILPAPECWFELKGR